MSRVLAGYHDDNDYNVLLKIQTMIDVEKDDYSTDNNDIKCYY